MTNIWALIVGINEYKNPKVKDLSGCVNDANAMASFLQDVFAVPDQQIKMLLDTDATRENILHRIDSFLLKNDEITPEDQILFMYAGHGSTLKGQQTGAANQEAQCLVAHDSRTEDADGRHIFDIPDTTLQILFNHLQLKNKQITVIFDCCHSASGLRNVLPEPAMPRAVDSDSKTPPIDLDEVYLSQVIGATRSGTLGDVSNKLNYTLLAACRTDELAYEYRVNGEAHGTFSYFLLEHLHNCSLEVTYEEICNRVAAKVTHSAPSQHPQCEGQLHRVFFSNLIVQRDAFINAQRKTDESVDLKAGTILGLGQGSKVDLYEDTVLTYADLPDEPVAAVEVITSKAFSSEAKVITAHDTLPAQMRGLVRDYGNQRFTLPVLIHSDDKEESLTFVKQLIEVAKSISPSSIRFVKDRAVIALVVEDGKANVYAINEEELFDLNKLGIIVNSPQEVHFALQKYARYYTLLEIQNSEPQAKVKGNLAVHLHPVSQYDPASPDASRVPMSHNSIVDLQYDPAASPEDNLYIVQVVNQSPVTVYLQVFVMNPDFGILRLYPRHGQQDPIQTRQSLFIGVKASGESPMTIELPVGWDVAHDYIKVIATTDYADMGWFEQDGLLRDRSRSSTPGTSKLDQLRKNFGSETRFGNINNLIDDWGATILPYTVTRIDV